MHLCDLTNPLLLVFPWQGLMYLLKMELAHHPTGVCAGIEAGSTTPSPSETPHHPNQRGRWENRASGLKSSSSFVSLWYICRRDLHSHQGERHGTITCKRGAVFCLALVLFFFSSGVLRNSIPAGKLKLHRGSSPPEGLNVRVVRAV